MNKRIVSSAYSVHTLDIRVAFYRDSVPCGRNTYPLHLGIDLLPWRFATFALLNRYLYDVAQPCFCVYSIITIC